MIVFTTLLVAFAACSKQTTQPAKPAMQPIAIQGVHSPAARAHVAVQQFEVTPQTLQHGQSATASVRLGSTDPDTLVRVNWFDPSGWSVFEATAPASSTRVTFNVPSQVFRSAGTYRAELRTGGVYQGEAKVEVSG